MTGGLNSRLHTGDMPSDGECVVCYPWQIDLWFESDALVRYESVQGSKVAEEVNGRQKNQYGFG